jgi:hypothetical protein
LLFFEKTSVHSSGTGDHEQAVLAGRQRLPFDLHVVRHGERRVLVLDGMRWQSEIVIAGAGPIGASTAFHLAQKGCRNVLVLDRAAALGGGSAPKATGGFRAQFDNETEVRLSLLSREKLRVSRRRSRRLRLPSVRLSVSRVQ